MNRITGGTSAKKSFSTVGLKPMLGRRKKVLQTLSPYKLYLFGISTLLLVDSSIQLSLVFIDYLDYFFELFDSPSQLLNVMRICRHVDIDKPRKFLLIMQ